MVQTNIGVAVNPLTRSQTLRQHQNINLSQPLSTDSSAFCSTPVYTGCKIPDRGFTIFLRTWKVSPK
ncbi:hypothetical protein MVEN_00401100 [Mycena venus]|uniref:Uncharacterized protein n=1 Tax=Mycena venus TaxID=2733690 RepID=A0A8H7DAV1_9AGAR|nr:hypothetical protein MVEN_00401100 [Mycena venus]